MSIDRPSPEQLRALRAQHGSIDAVRLALGVSRDKVRGWYAALEPEPMAPVSVLSAEALLRAENAELKARLAKDTKMAVADERLLRAIEAALESVPTAPLPVFDVPDVSTDAHHRQALLLSDFHGGEVVDSEVINGLNSYDWDVMLQRVDELIESFVKWQRNGPALTGLDVLILGDMCSGSNHDELAISNQFVLAEQGVKMGYVIADILERLAPHVPHIRALSVEGNHPRLSKAPAAKNPHDNMDWVAGIIARERVKLSGIEMTVARGSSFWEIAGRTCYVWHGDGIRSSMPGVPWGGVVRRTNEIAASHPGKRIDHFIFGHFHQANVVQGGRVIGNSALKGPDEWTVKNFGGGSPPCQLLLTFDEARERMTDVRYITPTAGL